MKKILAIAVALTAFMAVAAAQPRALGVRLGSASYAAGYGAELSYQHGLGTTNFVEIDLGWSSVGINGTASWDYILAEFGGGFDFYAGPGANLGMYNTADGELLCLTRFAIAGGAVVSTAELIGQPGRRTGYLYADLSGLREQIPLQLHCIVAGENILLAFGYGQFHPLLRHFAFALYAHDQRLGLLRSK
jgi:hypothetical protein